jgi:hypothetical protein
MIMFSLKRGIHVDQLPVLCSPGDTSLSIRDLNGSQANKKQRMFIDHAQIAS